MKENYLYHSVKGMYDVFPSRARRFQDLEDRARTHFALYGCGEIRTPIVENTRLFERSIGEGTDIVNKEMFYLRSKSMNADPRGDMVLRPEATASVARAYIENEIDKTSPGIQRYYYLGPMFRYERPQKGRQRQFTQIGVELIGSDAPAMDAEAIVMLNDYLSGLELSGLTLSLNSVGCPECRPAYVQSLRSFAQDHKKELCDDCGTRSDRNPLRLFDCKTPTCRQVMSRAPDIQAHLCIPCKDHQASVLDLIGRAKVATVLDPRLMRGLDYYTRTVFEMTSEHLGAQNAVAAGGRYNGLIADLQGPATPAVGWSAGVERLLELLPQEDQEPGVDVFVVDPGPDPAWTFQAVVKLRREGVSVRYDHEKRSPKALMKVADRVRARFAVFVAGDDPRRVQLKDLKSGQQSEVDWDDIPERIRSATP